MALTLGLTEIADVKKNSGCRKMAKSVIDLGDPVLSDCNVSAAAS